MSEKKSSFYTKILAKLRGMKKKPSRHFGVGATPKKAIVPAFSTPAAEPTEPEVAAKKAMDDRAAERDAKNAGLGIVPELKDAKPRIVSLGTPAPAPGQRWKDNDPRHDRVVTVVSVEDNTVTVKSDVGVISRNSIKRFTTKAHTRAGYTYVGKA